MSTYVPVAPPAPERSRWWWLRYWRVVYWLAGMAGIAAGWRHTEPGMGWPYGVLVIGMGAVALTTALTR